MAKVRAHKITSAEVTREHLESIIGVGARNIGAVERSWNAVVEAYSDVDEITPDLFTTKGEVSGDTAQNIVDWIRENVKFEPRIVSTDEIFEDENGEVLWDDDRPQRPLLALAFDPAKAIQEAAVVLAKEERKDDLSDRLILVMGWLRGEFLAPAPEVEIEVPGEEKE